MRTSSRLVCLLFAICLLPLLCAAQLEPAFSGGHAPRAAKGEVLVKFRELSAGELQGLARVHNLDRSRRLGGVARLYRFRSRSRSTEELVRQFSFRADVLYAEPNYVVQAVQQPNDPRFAGACTILASLSGSRPEPREPISGPWKPGVSPPEARTTWSPWLIPGLTTRILTCRPISGQPPRRSP
jgi:hypothetical protein